MEVHGGYGPKEKGTKSHFEVDWTMIRIHANGYEWDDMRSHV
jgi:hypothetical protein